MKIFISSILLCVCFIFVASVVASEPAAKSKQPQARQFKVGDPAPKFWGYNAGGDVYDYSKTCKGKTLLLVFWSLHDPDYQQLNQRLRKIRRQFLHEKNLTMVSQCVDQDYEAWMDYCNHQKKLDGNDFYSDARWIHQSQGGFNLEEVNSAKEYGVEKTPAFFLIGPDRKFLAVKIPEKDLVEQMKKVLKKQAASQ